MSLPPREACRQGKFESHADDFHYVMCGKIFRRRKDAGNLFVYMSCGGLLCCLNTTAGNSASLDDDIFRSENPRRQLFSQTLLDL
jgi:hypothetical protein